MIVTLIVDVSYDNYNRPTTNLSVRIRNTDCTALCAYPSALIRLLRMYLLSVPHSSSSAYAHPCVPTALIRISVRPHSRSPHVRTLPVPSVVTDIRIRLFRLFVYAALIRVCVVISLMFLATHSLRHLHPPHTRIPALPHLHVRSRVFTSMT